jgi:phenylpropionate dioxygenase-like ring-hydroxylating dioxygenase large terminal subunit
MPLNSGPYIVDAPERQMFRLNRAVLYDADVARREQARVFSKSWLYVGHESELRAPGDYRTRHVAGRPVIFVRGEDGKVRCLLNSCRHRGTIVCREREGNARRFFCFYHGWTYAADGALVNVPGEDAYGASFDKSELGLQPVPRFECYRDFWFASFDPQATPLAEDLAGAKEYLDLVVDTSPSGKLEIVAGVQEYEIAANWKLLVENSFDDYHLLTTHITWLGYLKDAGVEMKRPAEDGVLLPARGIGRDLGNGHACVDNVNFRGRPVARWIPIYGEDAKPEMEAIRAELVTRLGAERAARIADTNRNLVVFPNLVLNDGSSVTVRTFQPIGPERMKVTAWALGPVEESANARARRLDSFLTFYGPGGFATPDDVEALEAVQQGLAATEIEWSELSRGMNKTGETLNTDEHHLRAFWRKWTTLMTAP